jgi:hypothetical protein
VNHLIVSLSKKNDRPAVVFKRGLVLEGWAYLDELDENVRIAVLHVLKFQGTIQ